LSESYDIAWSPQARRAMAEQVPVHVAMAVYELVTGPLATNPHRVGKQLDPPMDDQWSARRGDYRVLYRIHEDKRQVYVTRISHRRDAYRAY
jgi:mRNA-degrading endonuclease RelE of RelBE toxin-antitoxin system